MRLRIVVVAMAAVAFPAVGQDRSEADIQLIVAPVVEAIAQERARQSTLPPPASTREQLERLGRLYQAPRRAIGGINFGALSIADRKRVHAALGDAIEPVDRANVEAFVRLLPEEGWFTIGDVGPEASAAAFHIVQHSDLALQKTVLPRLEPLARSGEIEGADFAAMFDRVATGEGRPQRYGTQYRCLEGRQASYPLEDPDKVEELRRPFNFTQTFAEAQAMQVGRACSGG